MPEPNERDAARFQRKSYVRPDGCHGWSGGSYPKGYSLFTIDGRNYRAHRVIYVWTYGEPNCDLHHVCGNRWCVNPEHIEAAASGQPRHRGPSPNFCAHGHEFTPENTYVDPKRGWRACKICKTETALRSSRNNREAINARKRARRVWVDHPERPCEFCGRMFKPVRAGKRFCSDRCQWTAHNRTRAARK